MASSMEGFEHLEIQLEQIKSATNNFNEENVIGYGGFGKVYKGELSHSQSTGKSLVALKRLDRKHGQGDAEFHKEVRMLSRYRHENIISLLGFSHGRDEMILVYEYASRGSLDHYLKDVNLTWTQRLKICLDAAKGLSYLHHPRETNQRLFHCDIKSANILLDENFKAKVSDFGLSKIGPANQHNSMLVTSALGTPGYCDPVFIDTYTLTKESDVYSFGVVLFEVLCGKLCFEYSNGLLNILVPMWKESYEEKKLDRIILEDIKQQMNRGSLETFSGIAYQCLKRLRKERPMMSLVVEKLELALHMQMQMLPKEYVEIAYAAVDPLLCRSSLEEFKKLLSKGVLLNGGKTWLSINEKGEHIERIYIQSCNPRPLSLFKKDLLVHPADGLVNSRFPGGLCYKYDWGGFEARVRGEYLTPQTSYTLNLVFRYKYESGVNSYTHLRYKIDREAKFFIIYPSYVREDGWFIVPLCQFTSQHKTADFQFDFEYRWISLIVAGFEFHPSEEKVQLQVFEEYQYIIEAASQSLVYTSLEELKQILSKGIHLNSYKTWFSLNEKGEHCHMISMKDCLIPNQDSTPQYKFDRQSRFPAGFYLTTNKGFKTHVRTQLLSPSISYTVNLVFYCYGRKLEFLDLKYRLRGETTTSTVYLANQREYDVGYMVQLYQFTSDGSIVDLEIDFDDNETNLQVEGILFHPLEKVEDQVSKEDKVENIQTVSESESDTYWEQKLPNDYEEILNLSKHSLTWTMKKGLYSILGRGFLKILNLSKDSLQWTTKKELYSILRRGFLINNGQEWFTIDKHGKKCLMLSAIATWVTDDKNLACESPRESRFGEVLVITCGCKFEIKREVKSNVISPETTYAAHLVYKLPEDPQSTFEAPMLVWKKDYKHEGCCIYLGSPPDTPVIGPKFDENTYNPLNRYKGNALPQQRTDGWMEVKVWEFQTTTETVSMHLNFKHLGKKDLKGLIVQGIDLRPI